MTDKNHLGFVQIFLQEIYFIHVPLNFSWSFPLENFFFFFFLTAFIDWRKPIKMYLFLLYFYSIINTLYLSILFRY